MKVLIKTLLARGVLACDDLTLLWLGSHPFDCSRRIKHNSIDTLIDHNNDLSEAMMMTSLRMSAVPFHQMISTDSSDSGGGLLLFLLLIIGFVIIWQSGKKTHDSRQV